MKLMGKFNDGAINCLQNNFINNFNEDKNCTWEEYLAIQQTRKLWKRSAAKICGRLEYRETLHMQQKAGMWIVHKTWQGKICLGNLWMTCTNSPRYFGPSTWQRTRKIHIDNNMYGQSFYSNSILYVSTTIKYVIPVSQIIYIHSVRSVKKHKTGHFVPSPRGQIIL